jgi:ribose 5-phosphate isomerase B
MKIHLATDHAGFEHKEILKNFLLEKDYEVVDHGAYELSREDDYPDFIAPAAKAVSEDTESKAIIFGGSGQGEAMVANRYKGVRCAVYYGGEKEIVTLSRKHNDANMLSIGAHFVDKQEMIDVVELWLNTDFSQEERHVRRINKF